MSTKRTGHTEACAVALASACIRQLEIGHFMSEWSFQPLVDQPSPYSHCLDGRTDKGESVQFHLSMTWNGNRRSGKLPFTGGMMEIKLRLGFASTNQREEQEGIYSCTYSQEGGFSLHRISTIPI